MLSDFSQTINNCLSEAGREYNKMCSIATNLANANPDHPLSLAFHFLGRQVRYLRNDVIPAFDKNTPEFISSLARNSFWIIPCLAFSLGKYSAFTDGVSTMASSWLHSNIETRTMGEHMALCGFVKHALSMTVTAITCVATRNPVFAVGLLFNAANLVKHGLIVQGKDVASSK